LHPKRIRSHVDHCMAFNVPAAARLQASSLFAELRSPCLCMGKFFAVSVVVIPVTHSLPHTRLLVQSPEKAAAGCYKGHDRTVVIKSTETYPMASRRALPLQRRRDNAATAPPAVQWRRDIESTDDELEHVSSLSDGCCVAKHAHICRYPLPS